MAALNPRPRPSNRHLRNAVRVLALLVTAAVGLRGYGDESREYQIKAAFLFNFARFVEWPAGAFETPESPLRLCVLGEDPFGAALDQTVEGETVRERRVEVRRSRKVSEVFSCQMVFISTSETARMDEILIELSSRSILTVSELEGSRLPGGIINFVLVDDRVRFEINPRAADRSGIRISSELLRLGKVVGRKA